MWIQLRQYPKMESAAYFLVLLHLMMEENTNFALFTLEVMGQKGQKKWFLYQKAFLHLLLIPPVEHSISPVSLNAHLYTQRSWNLRRVCGSHFILCPAGNWAPLQIHQFSKSAKLFCFIPSSYVQKPEFQQNFFCDVFLDLTASVGTHLSSLSENFMYTQSSPLKIKVNCYQSFLRPRAQHRSWHKGGTQISKEWVCERTNMIFLKYCFRLH